ncbi:MAG: hypothetical protein IT381_10095 [Deltaproteobacteria bacterium]|nr:hypothetical protein [Deltaproteobacteria bacterium]
MKTILLVLIMLVAVPARADEANAVLTKARGAWTLGAGRTSGNLTIYPILSSSADPERRYVSLDDAMGKNSVRVSEVGGGDVPTLHLVNKSKDPLFIMTGELLAGAKQDRISAHDVLLDPTLKNVALSVYCVEAGRWRGNSNRFAAGYGTATKGVRRSAALKAPQGEIWQHVAAKSAAAKVYSPTGTLRAVMEDGDVRQSTERYLAALLSLAADNEVMIGFVATIDGEVSSADVFTNRPLFTALWPKLLRTVAIDAATPTRGNRKSELGAEAFLAAGIAGRMRALPNPGLGKEYKIEGEISGSMLVADGTLVHLALFSK